jgi:hypothetical protein
MNPRVITVHPETNYTLTLTFSNGEVRVFDVKPYLNIGIFRELQDKRLFNSVRPVLGSIQWQNGQDFCPDTLYLDGVPAPEPSQAATDFFASGNIPEESFYAETD